MHTGELHRCSLRIRSLRDKIGKRTVDRGSWHSVGSKLRESRWPFLGQMERREREREGERKGTIPFLRRRLIGSRRLIKDAIPSRC